MKTIFLALFLILLTGSVDAKIKSYAEIKVKATIVFANRFECNELDFGTITLKENNSKASIRLTNGNADYDNPDIVSVNGYQNSLCENISYTSSVQSVKFPQTVILKNETGETSLTLSEISADNAQINGTLDIPEKVQAGIYTGSFTITYTY